MFRRTCFAVAAIVGPFLLARAAQAQPRLEPYQIDWTKADQSAVDLSALLPAPAGKDGFITLKGEHLVRPDGARFRIFGTNLCGPLCFPDKDKAPLLAADIARLGLNVVRFHHMEATWGRNIFLDKSDNTRQLDPAQLDRLDFFVAELKKRGIYSNLNLNVSRRFKPGDGVRDIELLGYAKGATYFNPRLIELQQEYARQLLTHKNAYTGNEYRAEPAVVCVEMVNENSLLEAWCAWRLVGKDDPKKDATWGPLPVSYTEELTDLYNQWLPKNVSPDDLAALRKESGAGADGRVARLVPNQFAKASKLRFHTEAKFLMDTETRFFQGMRKLLKDELGVKALLVGSGDHNDSISGYPHVRSNAVLDIIDGHGYWEHPDIGAQTKIKNTPMVNDPLDSTHTQFARTPLAGRPFTVSETNHPFPHEYAAEAFVTETAYALLQDWDGLYWFDYGPGRDLPKSAGIQPYGWFSISSDPAKLTNMVASALMWHHQTVKPAPTTVLRRYTTDQLIESLRMDRKQRPFFDAAFPRSIALRMKTRWAIDENAPATPAYPADVPLGDIRSETGELSWLNADKKKGLILIDTPRAAGLIGFQQGAAQKTRHLSATVENPFCTILLTPLDDKPLAESAKLLLITTAKSTNTGIEWKDDRQTLIKWGKGPTLIEPVRGTITLTALGAVKSIQATPLTPEGRPLGTKIPATRTGDAWALPLTDTVTTWYVIDVNRN